MLMSKIYCSGSLALGSFPEKVDFYPGLVDIMTEKRQVSTVGRCLAGFTEKFGCTGISKVRGGNPLNKPHRYVPPQRPERLGFLGRFGQKTGIIYVRTTFVYQCVHRFNSK